MTEQTPGGASAENPDVAKLSYEEARDQLAQVVAKLEQGSPTLEESLALWERGNALAARCEQWLTGAKRRLEEAREQTQAQTASDDDVGGIEESA